MSITVSLGINRSDERYLTKDVYYPDDAKNIECDVYEPVDRINPRIILDKDKVNLVNINYMSIPEFGRKYFITNIVGEAGNKVSVYGHVDVLSTYDAEIRNCPLIAARSTNQYNFYLHDDKRIYNTYVENQYISIGADIGKPDTLYLITLGTGTD